MMRTSNPTLSTDVFKKESQLSYAQDESMTVSGTASKTGILLLLCIFSAGWIWNQISTGAITSQALQGWMMGGAIGGLVVAIATVVKKNWSPFTAPAYALLEGLVIGSLSIIFESQFPGIVMQAVGLTFGTFAAMLIAYKTGMIQVTRKFQMVLTAAIGGIFLLYIASMLLGFFGIQMPYIFGNGPIGIGFSLVVVIVAALSLALDFEFITQSEQYGAPKYMEWYGAFSLMVTLIWLYIEILRLLSKLRSRN